MPLQNRVTPEGAIIADPARGLFMGNRGGRIHDPDTRTLTRRRFASRRWICCVTAFKNRRRAVMGAGYTELFFLDEPTALAAGHRPCFECRRADALAFAGRWQEAQGLPVSPKADAMDAVLHRERLGRKSTVRVDDLPDGVAILAETGGMPAPAFLRGDGLLAWMPDGYAHRSPRPTGVAATLLTPPAIVAVLAAGYRPVWHDTAG